MTCDVSACTGKPHTALNGMQKVASSGIPAGVFWLMHLSTFCPDMYQQIKVALCVTA